jgi:tetratricopeptide (TPR) repeat protein
MSDQLGEADLALQKFDGATALTEYETALTEDGTSDRAAAGRVRALWLLRRWDEARTQLGALADRTDSFHVSMARGVVALGQPDDPSWLGADCGTALRDDAAAAEAFQDAMRLDPASADALAGYGVALRLAGRLAEARRMLADTRPRLRLSAPVQVELAMCEAAVSNDQQALEHARLALEDDPRCVQAELVRMHVRRNSDPGSRQAIELVEKLLGETSASNAVVLQWYGWAFLDRGDVLSDQDMFDAAREQFTLSRAAGPVIPGAVLGTVAIDIARNEIVAALELVNTAIKAEPTSPQLHASRADAWSAAGQGPQERLKLYGRVLELDPRDLNARMQQVRALIRLNRTAEAQEIVDGLRAELPGNSLVELASSWLREPSQMPESHAVRTRVDSPWEGGKDDPDQILKLLTVEAVKNLGMPRLASTRLRNRVAGDRTNILQRAYEDEQEYLRVCARYVAAKDRAEKGAHWRLLGMIGYGLGLAVAVVALDVLVWLVAGAAGLPAGWRLGLAAGVTAAVVGAGLWQQFGNHVVDLAWFFVVVQVLAVAGTSVWLGVLWLGAGWGILTGIAVAVAVVGLTRLGADLVNSFAKLSGRPAQAAFDKWMESLYGNGVLPAAIEAIGTLGSPYSTSLSAPGGIAPDVPVEIDTPASAELRKQFRLRSRGSFALAGPRGAGKSTLLDRWCAGQFLREADADSQRRHDLTVKVDAPVSYQSMEFLTHLFGRLCDEVETYARQEVATVAGTAATPADDYFPNRLLRAVIPAPAPPSRDLTLADLAALARRERKQIRYVRGQTMEGELSLGLPAIGGTAVGAKRRTAVRRDEVPLNHPELVDRFRRFLGKAEKVVGKLGGKVLIGIDELDRISDGEQAEQFLNELKAVFSVPNCFFLVSVSEDALADFELTAMGMRTVFDSAFDKIVRVDYLSFDQARQLLNRRIFDLPEQFTALTYVLSGGLARELSRVIEEVGSDESTEPQELGDVARRLVRLQLRGTTRAVMDRLIRSADRRAGAALIPLLDECPVDALTGDGLREFVRKVAGTRAQETEADLAGGIRSDIEVKVEYLAVLLDVFNGALDKERMAIGVAKGPGNFETLARVRRYLGANPHAAMTLLRAFCTEWNLTLSADVPAGAPIELDGAGAAAKVLVTE